MIHRALSIGLLVAPSLLGLAAAPAAHADAMDNAFLSAMKARGIDFSSPQAALTAAHQVCRERALGKHKPEIANEVMANSGLDGYHAGYFVGAAVAAYCPTYR
ncbi:DUF732 domain-containing protein [Mycobacterium alsense]|uniref:DUF732 domain-containing protein n=1 Tax=Mycobacterium alsense TaxID=324058 RepID=UPI0009EDEAD6|nr:DUF732 domain-containing protein [Mycobacterium alsense]